MSELGPEAREILRNGRDGDDPSPADRTRIHSALMASIAAGAAVTVAGQASASTTSTVANMGLPSSVGVVKPITMSLAGTVFGKGLLILFLGAAGIGALLAWPSANSSRAPIEHGGADKPTISTLEPTAIVTPVASTEAESEPPMIPPSLASVLVVPAKPPHARVAPSVSSPVSSPKVTEETEDSLVAETQRLREAHGALRGGDPEKALALLSARAAEGEGQKLREERAAARVLALCKLGRVDEANAEAAAFLAQNPRSPLADRVRKACTIGR